MPTASSATGTSEKEPTRRPIRWFRSCSRRGIASRVEPWHLALFRDPQIGIVGDVAAQSIRCQAVADHAFVVVALPYSCAGGAFENVAVHATYLRTCPEPGSTMREETSTASKSSALVSLRRASMSLSLRSSCAPETNIEGPA